MIVVVIFKLTPTLTLTLTLGSGSGSVLTSVIFSYFIKGSSSKSKEMVWRIRDVLETF
jgi:hypothetical protein